MKPLILSLLLIALACSVNATICPKGNPPAKTLYVADVSALTLDDQLLFSSLQGITAQKQPRIYLIRDRKADQFWLDWMIKKGYVEKTVRVNPWELPQLFKSEINGAVVPDPDLPASINIATMLSGVYQLLICTPEKAQNLGLKVRFDLRGRWHSNQEAYEWAFERLGPKLNRQIVCCLYPTAAGHWVRDYLVQQRIFTFWINDDSEKDAMRVLLKKWPANIPVIGFWSAGDQAPGISEYGGLVFGGEISKFTVVYDWATNTSVHSGIQIRALRQKHSPKLKLDRSKVYVVVHQMDSGDAPWYWERAQLTNWQDNARGTFPMGWCVGPATLDLLPDVLQWYYEHATANDYFYCAMSGAGYLIPQHYADTAWKEYMDLTAEYMKRLDLDMVGLHMDSWGAEVQYDDSTFFKRYVDGIPGLKGILSDFGRMESLDPKRANHLAGGVPVFHTRNRWLIEGDPAEYLAKQIRDATPGDRPAFLSIMALSWTYTPSIIKAAMDRLGGDYVFVTPEQMAELFRVSTKAPKG
jgi:hypothetical protein